jgi:hypothetical protein
MDRERGYEIHHIVPKCIGGCDSDFNLVKLTYREHFIAHKLLCKVFPDDVGINYSLLCMLRDRYGYRNLTSKQISYAKHKFSEFRSNMLKTNNPMFSAEAKLKHSVRMKNSNPTRNNPACNRTAQPIEVHFTDNTIKTYTYAKALSIDKDIPYNTVKWMLRTDKGSPKNNILKIKRLNK